MMNYAESYRKELHTSRYYRTTLKDFMDWFNEDKTNGTKKIFFEDVEEDIFKAAYDFSIPVIMVKYLIKHL